MKLSDIILNEEPQPRQKVVDLNSLTFDLLLSIFGNKPAFGFDVPNPDDSSTSIHNQEALDRWKAGIADKYGNVNIKIDTEAAYKWDKIKILDDKFIADKKAYTAAKGAWLDKERQAGRNSGLD
jgi:hypothetical protein